MIILKIRQITVPPTTPWMIFYTPNKRHHSQNILVNFPVTIYDISHTEDIYGPSVPILKGNSIRKRSENHTLVPCISLLTMIMEHHSSVKIFMDLLFMNGTPYYHTKPYK